MIRVGVLTLLGLVLAQGQEKEQPAAPAFKLEAVRAEADQSDRAAALAAALGFAGWPRPPELYVAPAVSRALLREPERMGEETRSCTAVRFGEEPWGQCTWTWKPRAQDRKAAAGGEELSVQITLAPDARAAQEHLLVSLVDNMMPIDGLVGMYQSAKRPERLGSVALLLEPRRGSAETRLWFVRGNVVFSIRGQGALGAQVLPIASALDGRLLAERPLTPDGLRARRPQVRLGERPQGGQLTYQLAGGGREVVAVESVVGGRAQPAAGGSVRVGPDQKASDVEVVAVTRELVAGSSRAKPAAGR